MKRRLLMRIVPVAIIIVVVWGMIEKSDSYSEPQEALFAIDNDLLLIPGYKLNGRALFFFIKNENNLGAAYVQKDLFGWKADILTWSPMDSERNYDNDHLNGAQGQGANLIYGLIKHGDDRIVQVGEEQANILNLAMLPTEEIEKFRLEGLYIWYLESDQPSISNEIKLLDKETGEEIEIEGF